jgi:hypothetical protein
MSKRSRATKIKRSLLNEIGHKGRIRCFYCNCRTRRDSITLEHILPDSLGGATDRDNCVLVCEQCNIIRSKILNSMLIIDKFEKFINEQPNRQKHYYNLYWSHVNSLAQCLVKHSDRVKICFDDAISWIEQKHRDYIERGVYNVGL